MKPSSLFPSLQKPFIFGHRGYSSTEIENTMPSFEKCLTEHISGIEFDIHLIKSGEIVVIHDHNLQRLLHKDLIVEELYWDELKTYVVGTSPQRKGEPIPLLEEVLSTYKDTFYYDIELKVPKFGQKEIVEKTYSLIKKYKVQDKVLVSSFNPFIVRRWNKETQRGTNSGIIYSEHEGVPKYLHKGQGRYICKPTVIKPHHELITPSMVETYHKHNYKVVTWSVNEEKDVLHVCNCGVDGIISDDPFKVYQIVNNLEERPL